MVTAAPSANADSDVYAYHGDDYIRACNHDYIQVNDREGDGNNVYGQAKWWYALKGDYRVMTVWDYSPSASTFSSGNPEGRIDYIRVCEEGGTCPAWKDIRIIVVP